MSSGTVHFPAILVTVTCNPRWCVRTPLSGRERKDFSEQPPRFQTQKSTFPYEHSDENESGNPGHTHPGASALLWGGVFIDREIAVDRFASMVNQLVRGSILLYEKSPSRSTTTTPILVIFPSLPCRFDFEYDE
ncbi:hypothetical protein Q3G72_007770 [Acer saccharum]|nr:hypothetical protein Q3G72_018584 [Acer saccharum]KAK1548019.1 hypothetical protein Q3G72_007770 [Acer saccharum]